MKDFEIVNYNWDTQRLDVRINRRVKNGYFIIKDIDLDTTVYKFSVNNPDFTLNAFMVPTPRHGFDFQREDFGGFLFELIDDGIVVQRDQLRFRHTDMYKYKQEINDFYHPVFVNYREFFVYDRYQDFPLGDCQRVIDAGASVGLFTRYMLNKGAQEVISIECDDRSIAALTANFSRYPKVKIVPKAVSDSVGEMELFWKDDNPLVNTLDPKSYEFSENTHNQKIVPTTTLVNVIEEAGWDHIDLIKIDIEGSEYAVLDSTPDSVFLNTKRVLLEYHWPEGRLDGIIKRFHNLGFSYIFEPGCDGSELNGTICFFR